MSKECVTHHHACDCREAEFKVLAAELIAVNAAHEKFCEDAQEKTDEDFKVVRESIEKLHAENEKLKDDKIRLMRDMGLCVANIEKLYTENEKLKVQSTYERSRYDDALKGVHVMLLELRAEQSRLTKANAALRASNAELIAALKFECGNRCADQNPCNAKEVLAKHGAGSK